MRIVLLVLLLLVTSSVLAEPSDSWYTGWPKGLDSPASEHQIPGRYVSEIPHSLFNTAEQLLATTSFLAIGNNYFPARIPNCPSGREAYLVRALYEHGSTGTFEIYAVGSVLLIRHYALGPSAKLHRSALIVCLGFKPSKVYIATGGAM